MINAAVSAALSIPVGAICGVLYDVIRLLRLLFGVDVRSPFRKKGIRRWFSYGFVVLGDLFFFAVAAVLMCVFFFLTGDGRARWYGLVGAGFGFFCYYHTFGRLLMAVAERIASFCRRLSRRILHAFLQTPLVLTLRARYTIYMEKKKTARAEKRRRRQIQKRKSYCKN